MGELLERTAGKILLAISMLLLWGLTYYSMRYTQVLQDGTEIPLDKADSMGRNLIVFFVVVTVFFLLRNGILKKRFSVSDRMRRTMVASAVIYVAIVSVVWVTICHVVPQADGARCVEIAASFLQGDYRQMMPPGYLCYFPHQYSLVAVIQLQFYLFGSGNYLVFQYMNALCMPLLFYSGYQMLMLIYGKLEPVLYYVVLFVSCLPLFLYVPYVYGEITSITFNMVLMWQVVRYCKTGKRSCWVFGTLAVVFACMMRMNSLIVLIAAGIVLVAYAVRNIKPQAIAWLLAMIIAVYAANGCVRAYYEKVSGNEILDGVPYISWVLMGLQDSGNGPGWYNGTNDTELTIHDLDAELTAIDNKRAVEERLSELYENKAYAVDFFRRKILSQWNSPAYHSFFETGTFDCSREELPDLVRRIYYDEADAVMTFMNRYQFVLYFCSAIMATVTFFCRKKERWLEDYILLIAVVGGFLFSILWEALSRYVLAYVVFMIPLASVGMWKLQEMLCSHQVPESA